jgi:putative ABC transport system ATP-binding protein
MLKLHGITRTYRNGEGLTQALHNVNIEIGKGEFVAVMGPSGCGKSTLLNIIGLLDRPSAGRYFFHDEDVAHWPDARLGDLRKTQIGVIFQAFNLLEELSVYRNVELALLYHSLDSGARRRRVEAVLEKVGLGHRAQHHPGQLSGGQQQRVALARAIVTAPPLLLADEPTGNLDSANGREVMELLKDLNAEGTTIVMVTHNPFDADYAQRTINLFDGTVAMVTVGGEPRAARSP